MLKKIFLILGLITMCMANVAFADVPDPYGRPRPRPRPEFYQFNVSRIGYYNEVSEQPDKVKINFLLQAPDKAMVVYTLKTKEGKFLSENSLEIIDGRGEFDLYLERPEKNAMAEYVLEMECQLKVVKTGFGYKLVKNPVFKDKQQCDISLFCNEKGYCEMEVK